MTEGEPIVDALRGELAARPFYEGHTCPSWPRYARWLREQSEDELAAWIEDELAAVWDGSALELLGVRMDRVVEASSLDDPAFVGKIWRGEIDWSWWFGPFLLAYVGDEPDPHQACGVLATFLLPERVFGEIEAENLIARFEPGTAVSIPIVEPREGAELEKLLAAASERVHEQTPLTRDGLSMSWTRAGPVLPQPGRGRHGVVTLPDVRTVDRLHPPALATLASVAIIAVPEILDRVPIESERRPWHGLAPAPIDAPRVLPGVDAELFACLERELDARPVAEAHLCPSWPVLYDWLLSEGHELFARWLRAALAAAGQLDAGAGSSARSLSQIASRAMRARVAAMSPRVGSRLDTLWSRRGQRIHWFGPFAVAYFDPELEDGIGAHELSALLGHHGLLLSPARIHTRIDRAWLLDALELGPLPTLAPMPVAAACETVAGLLAQLGQRDATLGHTMRVVAPGQRAESRPTRVIATNIGPIAADHESTALLCCEDLADIQRHADDWDRLATFHRVVVLAPTQLLDHWPHGGRRIPAFR